MGGEKILHRALAGLEAGVVGAGVMLLWFAIHSIWTDDPWWTTPNLLASTFYGNRVFRMGFGWPTLAGAALQLCSGGAIGVAYAFGVGKVERPAGKFGLALLTGLAWYYVLEWLLWRRMSPLVPIYASTSAMWFAHFVYGVCLTRYHHRLQSIQLQFQGSI